MKNILLIGNSVVDIAQDIWKFNPEEYHNKWNVGNNYLESRGLELVDKAGTPIIFE